MYLEPNDDAATLSYAIMIKNYLSIALRNFWKQKTYTLLNIGGLAIALATATLSLLYVLHEFSYDRWIPNQENIYRIYREWSPGQGNTYTPYMLSETLREEFPEIINSVYIIEGQDVLISTEQKPQDGIYVESLALVDSTFLQVMPLPLKYGDAEQALQNNHSLLISEPLAEQLYGDHNPLGEILRLNDETDYLITGVMAEFAGNTHFDVDVVGRDTAYFFESWTGNNPATYVTLHSETDIDRLGEKITAAINPRLEKELAKYGSSWEQYPEWKLQPISDAHLNATAQIGGPFSITAGGIQRVYIIGIVGLLMLIVASINYMNLATAQAARRAREVGVRKVNGAARSQLVFQFLAEATLQCLVALPVAILLAELALPAFVHLTDRELALGLEEVSSIAPLLLGIVLILGLLSGSYPAFFLASYRPTEVLKGKWLRRDKGKMLRQGMVVVQFAGAIVAAVVMTFIYRQVQFMQDQELGFQSEQVMVIRANTQQTYARIQSLRSQLLQNPEVKAVTAASRVPGRGRNDYMFRVGGEEQDQSIEIFFVDDAYDDALNLELLAGRFLKPSDTTLSTFVVNESLIKEYDIKEPIGHTLSLSGADETGTIVGVIKDFHYSSLERQIESSVFTGAIPKLRQGWVSYVAVRLSTSDLRSTVAEVENFWQLIEPAHPIRYTFLDDDFAQLYADQQRLGQTLLWATLLTLFVALLGLFGLAAYMAEQRTKEVGVRKVLGASVSQITALLSKDFLKIVLIAGVIAVPISFWLARQWLTDFAYQTPITAMPFVLAVVSAVLTAVITVGSRAIRAARANPAESLRSE
jgi:putative ABC transport system permease protein